MTESEILRSIMDEAASYRTNIFGIGGLIKEQDNYYAAQTENYRNFSGCPCSYKVLENAFDLCELEPDFYDESIEDCCEECWRKAVKDKMNGVI